MLLGFIYSLFNPQKNITVKSSPVQHLFVCLFLIILKQVLIFYG